MPRRAIMIAGLSALLAGTAAGCGWWGDDEPGAEGETSLPLASITTAAEPQPPPALPEPASKPPLSVGDAFPMLRTVTQTLTQNTPSGRKTAQCTLQALLTLRVEEIRPDGRRRLSVRYDRVRYVRDLAGEPLDYDSGLPPQAPLPLDAEPYRGLAGNGFSFWLDANGAVVELVGFDEFLKRCMGGVPSASSGTILQQLAACTAGEGIAGFVDDSIGLLPAPAAGSQLSIGQQWTHRRSMARPLPVRLETQCTLVGLNDSVVELNLGGVIAPAAALRPGEALNEIASITVRGGRTVGQATIDRRTGLPLQSRIEHYIDMLVQPAAGAPFEQRKHVVTTLQALPQPSVSADR